MFTIGDDGKTKFNEDEFCYRSYCSFLYGAPFLIRIFFYTPFFNTYSFLFEISGFFIMPEALFPMFILLIFLTCFTFSSEPFFNCDFFVLFCFFSFKDGIF